MFTVESLDCSFLYILVCSPKSSHSLRVWLSTFSKKHIEFIFFRLGLCWNIFGWFTIPGTAYFAHNRPLCSTISDSWPPAEWAKLLSKHVMTDPLAVRLTASKVTKPGALLLLLPATCTLHRPFEIYKLYVWESDLDYEEGNLTSKGDQR